MPHDAQAALELPPAPTACAPDAYHHTEPAFCISPPAGFAVRATGGDDVELADDAHHLITIEWSMSRDLYASFVAHGEAAGEVRWRGELPGGRGVAWLFAVRGSPMLAGRAVVRGPYHLFTCQATGAPVLSDALAQLAACRSLIVLGEPPAAALEDLLTSEVVELPTEPAWRTCGADHDCIVLHSPCGDATAPINRA